MLHLLYVLTWLRAIRAHVLTYLHALRAYVLYMVTCLRGCVLTCLRALRAFVLICLRAYITCFNNQPISNHPPFSRFLVEKMMQFLLELTECTDTLTPLPLRAF